MKELRHHRTECAAGHNDGTFRAEWASRTNGNCRRQGFQNRQFRFYRSAFQQYGFDGLRYAMSANPFRSISGHQPDDHRSHNGNENDEESESMIRRRNECSTETLIEE